MKTEDEVKNITREKKNQKKFYKTNCVIVIIAMLLILLQIAVLVETNISEKSTISIFGYRAYISRYSDYNQNIEEYDLVIVKKEEDYNKFPEVVYKVNTINHSSIIVESENYSHIQNDIKNISGKIVSINNKLGKIILILREPLIILCIAIIIILLLIISNFKIISNTIKLPKKYKIIKRAKELLICIFVIITYVIIFLIGNLIPYNDAKMMIERDIEYNDDFDDDENEQNKNSVENENINGNYNENANGNSNENMGENASVNENTEENILFIIKDDDKTWNQSNDLAIFYNEFYKSNKIAPGVYGKYNFEVKNESNNELIYKINFSEENLNEINLQYKIIKNGEYLNSEYKKISDISDIKNIEIKPNITDTYSIEWKWIDNYNDTQIGKNAENIKYNLKIRIDAMQK